MRTTSLKRGLVNFNVCGSIEYKNIGHFYKTVKFWFVQKTFTKNVKTICRKESTSEEGAGGR